MSVYDLEEAFKIIEDDLVNQIINGIKKTTSESVLKEDNITVWRTNQLKELQEFKKRNKKYFTKDRKKALYKAIENSLEEVYKEAGSKQQKKILDAVKDGLKVHKSKTDDEISLSFTGVNDRKLNSLIAETQKNLYSAETSAVRYAEDQYRQIIFNSNVYFNTGSGNLMKCIDMATRNFLEAGINNIEYKNGHRVNIQSYAEMALRTAEKRSYIQGEAKMRDEYGLGLVIVNRRGNACPKCMQFVGKIFNDDVYGSQKPNPKYPLLSTAIAGGLYHPNCKDVHTSYFPGITTKYPAPTKKDLEAAEKQYKLEQQQRYNERQIRKYKRLADGTLDEQEAKTYKDKVSQWQEKQRELINENPTLRRNYIRESVLGKTKPSTKTFEVPELPEEPKKIVKKSFTEKEKVTTTEEKVVPAKKKKISFMNFERDKANKFFYNDKAYKQWAENLTEDEKWALDYYSGNNYTGINNGLRGLEDYKLNATEKRAIKLLDKTINDFELTENIKVYRDAYADVFQGIDVGVNEESLKELKKFKGTIFHDNGFMSTGMASDTHSYKDLKFEIEVPKGKGLGAYINKFSQYEDKEYEFLLRRDTDLLITDMKWDDVDDRIIVKARVIPKE